MNSLRRLMEERGLSQTDLARMSGVGREMICQASLGRKKLHHAANVAALAWALDVPPDEFADVYAGKDLPSGPAPRARVGLSPHPLADEIRRHMDDVPHGFRRRFLKDRSLPEPCVLRHRRRLLIENAEELCDRLGVHPVDVYGDDYYEVSA